MKRLCSLMLALALSLALFAGCGEDTSSVPQGDSSSSVTSSQPQEVETPEEDTFDGQPLTGEAKDCLLYTSRCV